MVKSKIQRALAEYNTSKECTCYQVDVDKDGRFTDPGSVVVEHGKEDDFWDLMVNEKVCFGFLYVGGIFSKNLTIATE